MERCAEATKGSLSHTKVLSFINTEKKARHGLTISGVRIDGLEKAEGDPNVDGDDVHG